MTQMSAGLSMATMMRAARTIFSLLLEYQFSALNYCNSCGKIYAHIRA